MWAITSGRFLKEWEKQLEDQLRQVQPDAPGDLEMKERSTSVIGDFEQIRNDKLRGECDD